MSGDGVREIQQLFRGAGVFVTGGTGFLGKVLLAKLLRACPDIRTVFLLMRSKKGKSQEKRFAELFEGKVSEIMRRLERHWKFNQTSHVFAPSVQVSFAFRKLHDFLKISMSFVTVGSGLY
jgi:nucleoside-diphosphate-sugar epimerase